MRLVLSLLVVVSVASGGTSLAESPLFAPDPDATESSTDAAMKRATEMFLQDALSPSWNVPADTRATVEAIGARMEALGAAIDFVNEASGVVYRATATLDLQGEPALARLDQAISRCKGTDGGEPVGPPAHSAADLAAMARALQTVMAGHEVEATGLDESFDAHVRNGELQKGALRLKVLAKQSRLVSKLAVSRERSCVTLVATRDHFQARLAADRRALTERESALDSLTAQLYATISAFTETASAGKAVASVIPALNATTTYLEDSQRGLEQITTALDLPGATPELDLLSQIDRLVTANVSREVTTAAAPEALDRAEIADLIATLTQEN